MKPFQTAPRPIEDLDVALTADMAIAGSVWMPVPGFEENYEVSDQGEVRSRPRAGTKGGTLKPFRTRGDYLQVGFRNGTGKTYRTVHWVVTAAFLGPRPAGLEVRHLDGDKENCALSNLTYGTRSENGRDKRQHGTDRNVNKTQCLQGHPYDEVNTYFYPTGGRACRTCRREARRRYRLRNIGVTPRHLLHDADSDSTVPAIRADLTKPAKETT